MFSCSSSDRSSLRYHEALPICSTNFQLFNLPNNAMLDWRKKQECFIRVTHLPTSFTTCNFMQLNTNLQILEPTHIHRRPCFMSCNAAVHCAKSPRVIDDNLSFRVLFAGRYFCKYEETNAHSGKYRNTDSPVCSRRFSFESWQIEVCSKGHVISPHPHYCHRQDAVVK